MRNLIDFFIRHLTWFVFIFYVGTSCALLFQSNPYQHHVYLTSANNVCASVYGCLSGVSAYFHLHEINEDLHQRNAALEMEVINLRRQVDDLTLEKEQERVEASAQPRDYDYIFAHVISNSVTQPHNYITINRGSDHGIKPEMGVVDHNGVVGIVNVVGKRSARIISLLNPDLRLSCKVKDDNFFGSLVWDGKDPYHAVLEEMPRHVQFQPGDTIVTSGYSAVFPEGLIVGTIESQIRDKNDNFFSLRIRLTTDFTQLSTVRAISNNMRDELKSLENPNYGGKEAKK